VLFRQGSVLLSALKDVLVAISLSQPGKALAPVLYMFFVPVNDVALARRKGTE
jgi:hypothetical protein